MPGHVCVITKKIFSFLWSYFFLNKILDVSELDVWNFFYKDFVKINEIIKQNISTF